MNDSPLATFAAAVRREASTALGSIANVQHTGAVSLNVEWSQIWTNEQSLGCTARIESEDMYWFARFRGIALVGSIVSKLEGEKQVFS
jgi:hypothetical protein